MDLFDCVILSKLSYDINNDVVYTPRDDNEKRIFSKLSNIVLFFNDEETDAQCCLFTSKDLKTLYISVRGSNSIHDFKENLDYQQINYKDSIIKFHKGFYNQATSLFMQIFRYIEGFNIDGGREIVLCGHSSGGATASIIAVLLTERFKNSIAAYVYGAPIFTNEKGVLFIEQNINYNLVIDAKDPIPRFPLKYSIDNKKIEYSRINKTIYLIKNNKLKINEQITSNKIITLLCCHVTKLKYHFIENYIYLCEKFFLKNN